MLGAMQGLTSCLAFTVETEEDFTDGWLPTLDIKLRVLEDNQIAYTFFTKPTASNKCLQADTALNHNCVVRSLSNEVMRRLANMSSHVGLGERVKVMDEYSLMMVTSGHGMEVVRQSLVSGMKGHVRKVARCIKEGKPFHRCASASAQSRKSKKLTQKSSWFKNKADESASDTDPTKSENGGGGTRQSFPGVVPELRKITYESENSTVKSNRKKQPSTVLFVEFS